MYNPKNQKFFYLFYYYYTNCIILNSLISHALKALFIKLYAYIFLTYYYIIIFNINLYIRYIYKYISKNHHILIWKIVRNRIESTLYLINNYLLKFKYYVNIITQFYQIIKFPLQTQVFSYKFKQLILLKLVKNRIITFKKFQSLNWVTALIICVKTNSEKRYQRRPHTKILKILSLLIVYLIILGMFEFMVVFLMSTSYSLINIISGLALNSLVYSYYGLSEVDNLLISCILYFTEFFKLTIVDRSILVKILSLTSGESSVWGICKEVYLFCCHSLNNLLLNLNYWLWLKQTIAGLVGPTPTILIFNSAFEQDAYLLATLNLFTYSGLLPISYYFTDLWCGFTVTQTVARVSLLLFQNINVGAVFWWNLLNLWQPNFFVFFFSILKIVFNIESLITVFVVGGNLPYLLAFNLFNLYEGLVDAGFLMFIFLLKYYWFVVGLWFKDLLFFTACSLQYAPISDLLKEFFIIISTPYSLAWHFYGAFSVLPNFGVLYSLTWLTSFMLSGLENFVGKIWLWVFFGSKVTLLANFLWQDLVSCLSIFLDLFNATLSLGFLGWGVGWLNFLLITLVSVAGNIFFSTFLVSTANILWYYLVSLVFLGSIFSAVRHFFFVRTRPSVVSYSVGAAGFSIFEDRRKSSDKLVHVCVGDVEILPRGVVGGGIITRSFRRGLGSAARGYITWSFRVGFFRLIRFLNRYSKGMHLYFSPTVAPSHRFGPFNLSDWTFLKGLQANFGGCWKIRLCPTVVVFFVFKTFIGAYLAIFLAIKGFSSSVCGGGLGVNNNSQPSWGAITYLSGNRYKSANLIGLPVLQTLALFASLPLFLISVSLDFFFWVSGFTVSRFQFFCSQNVHALGRGRLLAVTFNSRFLREFGDSPLKFSSENFSAVAAIRRYFLFVDFDRPPFDISEFLTKPRLAFGGGGSELARDANTQYFKHMLFNALFAEHHYSYSLESLSLTDTGYFTYVLLFLDNVFTNILSKVDLFFIKLIFLPTSAVTWIFGFPFFGISANMLSTVPGGVGTKVGGVELVGRELTLLRFLVSSAFLNPSLLESPGAKLLYTRADWMSNQMLSWNWHYRWFNRWHSYAQRRSVRRLRGGSVREMAYIVNPYRIFEQLPDIIFPGALFTDDTSFLKNFQRLDVFLNDQVDIISGPGLITYPTGAFSKKSRYTAVRREMFTAPFVGELFRSRGSELGYYRALSAGFSLGGETSNGVFLRRYNAFFSDLLGYDKISTSLSGVGVWSIGFIPHDYFFRWFYNKYWTSKQSYYLKFLFYEKFQFFKRRKKRFGFGKLKQLQFWRQSVRSSHTKSLWRFNNYKRERLTRKLALFFYTVRCNFADFFDAAPLGLNYNSSVAYSLLSFNLNGFHPRSNFIWVYSLIDIFPLLAKFFIFWDCLLRAVLHQILQIFSFFLRTKLAPYTILPFEVILRMTSSLFFGFEQNWRGDSVMLKLHPTVFFFVSPVRRFLDVPNSLTGPTSTYFAVSMLPCRGKG